MTCPVWQFLIKDIYVAAALSGRTVHGGVAAGNGYILQARELFGDERCRQRGVAIGEWSSASGGEKKMIFGGWRWNLTVSKFSPNEKKELSYSRLLCLSYRTPKMIGRGRPSHPDAARLGLWTKWSNKSSVHPPSVAPTTRLALLLLLFHCPPLPLLLPVAEPLNLMPSRSTFLPLDIKYSREYTKLHSSVQYTLRENSKIHIFSSGS